MERSALRVLGVDIDKLVIEYIKKNSEDQEVKPKLMAQSSDLLLPRGELSYQVQPKGNYRKEGGYQTFNVTFNINGTALKTVAVRAYLKVYKEVYVAKETIKSDHVIEESDLKKVRTNVDQAPSNYVTDPAQLVGKLAKRVIAENEIIKDQSVKAPPVIQSGDRLLIVFETESLKLTVPGIALKSGGVGELIPVQNLKSRTIVHATVVDDTSVRVY